MNHDDGAYNIGPHMLYLVFLYYYESCGTFYSTGHKFRNADPIAPTLWWLRLGTRISESAAAASISLPGSAESGLANGESCRGCQNKRSAGIAYFSCTRDSSFHSNLLKWKKGCASGGGHNSTVNSI
jgi:hypothetical protein